MKTWTERRRWILDYIAADIGPVDVLNADFVWSYAEAMDVLVGAVPYGAPRCPRLGRDLSRMSEEGSLERSRTGIDGMAGMGFPRWVWSYRVARHLR